MKAKQEKTTTYSTADLAERTLHRRAGELGNTGGRRIALLFRRDLKRCEPFDQPEHGRAADRVRWQQP
jgi:hypothetical protein